MEEKRITAPEQENAVELSVADMENAVIAEPEMSFLQKIILCLMSAGLLFFAVSLHEFVPLIGFFAYLVYPIVVANLTYRYGYVMALGAMVIAHCCLGALWDPYVARAAVLGEGIIGLLFGFCFRRGYSGKRTFFTVAGVFISILLLFQLVPLSSGGVLGAVAEEAYMRTLFARKLIGALGASFVVDSFMMSSDIPTGVILAVFRFMVPAVFIFQQAFLIWLYYLAIGFAMKEMKQNIPTMPAIFTWQAPRWVLWTAVAMAVLDCFVSFGSGWFSFLSVNITVCSVLFFMVCGIGVFWYYLRFSPVSWFLKAVAVVLVIYFLSLGLGAAMLVGALDAIFDFRKLKKQGDGTPAATEGAAAVQWEKAELEKTVQEHMPEGKTATVTVEEIAASPEEKTVEETININENK